jgi:23S rRNA pseudouridine1911/1915/1917 synthase
MILFEDKDIIVCHKQAGIPVQSARIGQKDMVSILNNHLAEQINAVSKDAQNRKAEQIKKEAGKSKNRKTEIPQIHVVHRLDQPVEGIIVFAKNQKAAAALGRQITDGSMKKVYRAVCCVTERFKTEKNEEEKNAKKVKLTDHVRNEKEEKERKLSGFYTDKKTDLWITSGKIVPLVDYLAKDARTNTSRVVQKGRKDAKRAELSYQILDAAERKEKKYLLVQVDLKTGRHHQIRVQMEHAGLPLYGDRKYHAAWETYLLASDEIKTSDQRAEGTEEECMKQGKPDTDRRAGQSQGLALCAVLLTFVHPSTGKQMTFETEPSGEVFRMFDGKRIGG